MNYRKIFELILDIGAGMIKSGGETRRVEIAVAMLAKSYGFSKINFWVVPSNIQGTVTSPEDDVFTEMREINGTGTDYGRLDKLNNLSRLACEEKPDENKLNEMLSEIMREKRQNAWIAYVSGMIGVAGFAGFFGCDVLDILVAVTVSLVVTFAMRHLTQRESNPLIKNFAISLIAEFLILLSVHLGIGHHSGYITIGIVMMLISGLATTTGIQDIVHLDTFSGLSNIILSMTGAIGIALGIAVSLFIFRGWNSGELMPASPQAWVLLLSAAGACFGFAVCFGIREYKLLVCTIGGILTTAAYIFASTLIGNSFVINMAAACVTGIFAQIMSRIMKAPATIFNTFGAFPLIPGSSLYYLMYGLVKQERALAFSSAVNLFSAAFGIVMGLMAVEAAVKYLSQSKKIIKLKKL